MSRVADFFVEALRIALVNARPRRGMSLEVQDAQFASVLYGRE